MNVKRLLELVEKNKIIYFEDDGAQKAIWDEMVSILSVNINETIEYLNSASKDEIYYISSVYDDLSEIFQSNELITCMEINAQRTGVDCAVDIEYAKKALNHSSK